MNEFPDQPDKKWNGKRPSRLLGAACWTHWDSTLKKLKEKERDVCPHYAPRSGYECDECGEPAVHLFDDLLREDTYWLPPWEGGTH